MGQRIDVMSDGSERVPYNAPDYPLYVSKCSLSLCQDMGAASHWHDDLEFSVILSGHQIYEINGTEMRIEAGEGVFVNARQLHRNYSADRDDSLYTCVLIHPSLLCATQVLEEEYVKPLMTNGGFTHAILRKSVPWQEALMRTVQNIQEAYMSEEAAKELRVQSLAYEAAELLYRNMPLPERARLSVDRRFVALREMVGFVQRHYDERITLRDVAAAGNVSESNCCAIFRQQLRQTPIGYLTRYRLEKAMQLLGNPDLSITEIALSVGFSSVSYFTETFRKALGVTPSECRKRARAE